ncbi:LOW QUALITY PROTEIN: hypothetical protein KUTeg_016408 [Tegillarca granosa]|uniref:Reverse transcriptase n=1 Tax=Tegillarca granosa TaxID=220873 RepID=A0ABQ9ERF9_TEGGR|nr:LOW QUALITY PROTEIN: hypothetical protein KUTeg_016408 [Tegillarca granosa]
MRKSPILDKDPTIMRWQSKPKTIFPEKKIRTQLEPETRVEPKVINLSNKILTPTEIKLLAKGLKFTPTPRSNPQELKNDIKEYTRKLRSTEYFNTKDKETEESTADEAEENRNNLSKDLVWNKSNFNPKRGRNYTLDTVCNTLENIPLNDNGSNTKRNNLTKYESEALESLMNNDNIIIKEADKGGAVVVMDTEFYRDRIYEMLSNTEFYKKANGNQETVTMQKINKLINKHKKKKLTISRITIPKRVTPTVNQKFINRRKLRKPYIHKIRNMLCVAVRTIFNLGQFYIQDDFDFLNQLPKTVHPNVKLVTFDIINLYTNITCELGLKALNYWISKFPKNINRRLNPQQIIENGIQKALQIERTELLNPPRHENAETNILPLVTTHNP